MALAMSYQECTNVFYSKTHNKVAVGRDSDGSKPLYIVYCNQ